MDNVLVRRLEQYEPLSPADRELLDKVAGPVHNVPARAKLIREQELP